MRAIVQDEYGAAAEDVLRLDEVGRPGIGGEDVLVRVRAASVDRGTWHVMAGLPYPIRVAGFGLRAPNALNPGRSVAGVVEAVGGEVTAFAEGDEVFGTCEGSFAEYAVAQPERLAPKPRSLSLEQAAAVPVSAVTALQAVRDHGRVEAGEHVLVIGASGGVGTFAVQVAKAFGAEVTGVCSPAKVDLVRSLGADRVLDYTREDIGEGDRRYDVILDIGGNRRLSRLRRALTARGRLVIVGRRDRRPVARRQRPSGPRAAPVPVRAPDPRDVHREGERQGPRRAGRLADAGRLATGDRPDLSPQRDPGGHPPRAGRASARQGRHRGRGRGVGWTDRACPIPSVLRQEALSCRPAPHRDGRGLR